ncbi:hypothetical protein [Streptomyces sp. NPDC001135]
MTTHIDALADSWHDGQEIDVLPAMQTLTARVAAATSCSERWTKSVAAVRASAVVVAAP